MGRLSVLILFELLQIENAHDDGSVVFKDGSVVLADTILYCTGYNLLQLVLGLDAIVYSSMLNVK